MPEKLRGCLKSVKIEGKDSEVKGGEMEEEKRYPSDLTDREWAILESLIPAPKPGGHPRMVNIRELVNGIF